MSPMLYWLVIAAGILALLYGFWATRSVLAASAGNARMQEIAAAIQEGAKAYLNKQYTTIGIDLEPDPAAMTGTLVGLAHVGQPNRSRRHIASLQ